MRVIAVSLILVIAVSSHAYAISRTPGSNEYSVIRIANYHASYNEFIDEVDSNGYNDHLIYFGGPDADEEVVHDALGANDGLFVYEAHKVNCDGTMTIQYGSTSEDMNNPSVRQRVMNDFYDVYDLDPTLGVARTCWQSDAGIWILGFSAADVNPGNYYRGDESLLFLAMCNSEGETANRWGARALVRSTVADLSAEYMRDLCTTLINRMSDPGTSRHLGGAIQDMMDITYSGNGETTLSPALFSIVPAPGSTQASQWETYTLTFDTEVDVVTCEGACNPMESSLGVINGWIGDVQSPVDYQVTAALSGYTTDFELLIRGDSGTWHGKEIVSRWGHLPFNHGLDLIFPYHTSEVNPAGQVLSFWARPQPEGNTVFATLGHDRRTAFWRIERVGADGLITVASVSATLADSSTLVIQDYGASDNARYLLTEVDVDGVAIPQGFCTPTSPQDARAKTSGGRGSLLSVPTAVDPAGGLAIICPDSFVTALAPYVSYWSSCGLQVTVCSQPSWTSSEIESAIAMEYTQGIRYFQLVGSYSDYLWFDDPTKWPDDPNSTNDWFYWFNRYHTTYGYVSHPEWDIMPTLWYADAELENWSYYFPYYSSDTGYVLEHPGSQIGRFPAYNATEVAAWVAKTLSYNSLVVAEPWFSRGTVAFESHVNGSSGRAALAEELLNGTVLPGIPPEIQVEVLASTYSDYLTAEEKINLFNASYNNGRALVVFLGTFGSVFRLGSFIDVDNGWAPSQWAPGPAMPFLLGTTCESVGSSGVRYDASGPGVQRILWGYGNRGFIASFGPRGGSGVSINAIVARRVLSHLYMGSERSISASCMDAIRSLLVENPELLLELRSYSFEGCVRTILHSPSLTTDVPPVNWRLSPVVSPNPFNSAVTVSFTVMKDCEVTAGIYDARGRRVVSLADGKPVTAGRCTLEWDGRDERGASTASGVYFAKLEVDGRSATVKVALMK